MPTPLLWSTDVHLDHLPPQEWREFARGVREAHPDSQGWILTGDIGDAPKICDILEIIQAAYKGPIYFVLGNHDYYRGSFFSVDFRLERLCSQIKGLHWLRHGSFELAAGTRLLGVGGWYDAGYGDPESELRMSDFVLIEDLFEAQDHSRAELLRALKERADAAAAQLEMQMREAVAEGAQRLLIATHVPPFRESALHRGELPNDTWAPFFTSKATGDVLLNSARKNPTVEHTVLCGHTHSRSFYQPLANLTLHTAEARYGHPEAVARIESDAANSLKVLFERNSD